MPKFIIEVRHVGETETWKESYDKNVPDAHAWAKDTIDRFNASLRPFELARELVGVSVEGESQEHIWEKTNLVTIVRAGRMYDTCRCTRCGITGKRFGLQSQTRDPKYKAPKYKDCSWKKK